MTQTLILTRRRRRGAPIEAAFEMRPWTNPVTRQVEMVPCVWLSTHPGQTFYCRRGGRLGVHVELPNPADFAFSSRSFQRGTRQWFASWIFHNAD